MGKITFEKENTTISCVNGKLTVISRVPISNELIEVIENENNFKSINRVLDDLRVNHMIDKNASVISITLQDNQTSETISKAFEEIKKKHDRLFVLFQRLLECAKEAKKQERKSVSAKKGEGQCSEDHEGMFYQKNGTFQKEYDTNSWGLCIISNYKEDIIMSFEEKLIGYKDIIDKESLPSYLEMLIAFNKFSSNLNLSPYSSYWVCSDFGNTAVRSRNINNPDDNVGYLSIDHYPGYRNDRFESRSFRKVLRIKK